MLDIIVIESPNKIKKIAPLVKSARVLATVGHFKNLPQKGMGVDPVTLEPEFVYPKGKKAIADELKKAAVRNRVYIATDPDREGYAIGMHVFDEVLKKASSIHRLEIREITEKGIREAFAKSVPFADTNFHLYDAFLGRRIGDRIVGYRLSGIASKVLGGSYSVGRVQSPAVRLVVEREREIRAFKPAPYWVVHVLLEKDNVRFKAFHTEGNIKDKTRSDAILAKVLPAASATATDVEIGITRQSPRPPFSTPELQATASAQLRFSTDQAMRLAQELFAAGIISYHRTDSVRISDEFITEVRDQIRSSYGTDYLPSDPRRYKSKASQAEAHEAIRPTSMHPLADCEKVVRAEELSDDHVRLYELIYKRTVASQMADALFDSTTLYFDVVGEPFKAKGRVVRFEGFQKVYSDAEELKADKETVGGMVPGAPEDEEQRLPKIDKGEVVPKVGHDMAEKQTKPPGRYSEGTLVKALERLGIGRPSTYASIVYTIRDREYVSVIKGKLHPTMKGETIVDFLVRRFDWVVDYRMTKDLEEKLDSVEEGGARWKVIVSELSDRINSNEGHVKIEDRDLAPRENEPTGKQIGYANFLSEKHGVSLPPKVLSNKRKLTKWIRDVLKPVPKDNSEYKVTIPLSQKQMGVINRYAPEDVKGKVRAGNIGAGRAFLEEFFSKARKVR